VVIQFNVRRGTLGAVGGWLTIMSSAR